MQHKSKPAGTQLSCMQGGSGEDSYANCSSPQNFVFRVYTRTHLSEALDHLCRSPHILEALQIVGDTAVVEGAETNTAHVNSCIPRLAVADLGCSHGRNTLDYAHFILQGLQNRLCNSKLGSSTIEMQYLFSDLPANNFNSLFQSLQGFLEELGDGMHPSCKIFTAAVAGSFYGPLFPTCTLHFALSAFSLHWLSQVPPEVLDRHSPAWNGGSVWLHAGKRPKVVEAFASQYQKDMRGFFQNRARELVKGGVIFLLLPSCDELHPAGAFYDPQVDLWSDYFDSTWTELVCEGLISEEERDMFNVPIYVCHGSTELCQVLEEFVGVLEIIKMEVMNNCFGMPNEDEQKLLEDPQAYGKFWSSFMASLVRPMVESHIGEARSIELFKRLETHIARRIGEAILRKNSLLVAIIRRL